MTPPTGFTARQLEQLAKRGLAPDEAQRQLALLSDPPGAVRLDRACTPGDGIVRLDAARVDGLLEVHALAAASGRVTAFVPASGAATRMFKDLMVALAGPADRPAAVLAADARAGDAASRTLLAFVEGLPRFAFHEALREVLANDGQDVERLRRDGPWRVLLEFVLGVHALDYARRPKALIPFHRAPEGVRTALEEHLVEVAGLARGPGGCCRLAFTVSPEHRAGFEALLARAAPAIGARLGVRFEVGLSEQHPATDTIAADPAGGPFLDDAGSLLFRPAGHGALLRNLGELGADLVFLKNVDNVTVDRLKGETSRWSRALVGLAAELSSAAHALRARLADAADATAVVDASRFVRESLGEPESPASRDALAERLERPVRVCGMVPNTGEPGGGPFWVSEGDGSCTRQVVETTQVARTPEQQAVLRGATHFNPVFLACSLRDSSGAPYALERFVDERAVIVTRKSAAGRDLLALERPGLWNGAMARWNTVFVEVPLAVFNPVKTVLDLLRPEHQG